MKATQLKKKYPLFWKEVEQSTIADLKMRAVINYAHAKVIAHNAAFNATCAFYKRISKNF